MQPRMMKTPEMLHITVHVPATNVGSSLVDILSGGRVAVAVCG